MVLWLLTKSVLCFPGNIGKIQKVQKIILKLVNKKFFGLRLQFCSILFDQERMDIDGVGGILM